MKKIIDLLNELRPEFDYNSSQNFVDDGMLDSFDIVSLVSMIDKEYGVAIKGREITPENFSSLSSIKALLKKHGVENEV